MFFGFRTIFRTPQQKRVLYFLVSFWIMFFIFVAYVLLEPRSKRVEPLVTNELVHSLRVDVKTKRIFKICNPVQEISAGDEANLDPKEYALRGLLTLIRHGDRGPLQHIKDINNINCGTPDNDLLTSYKNYLKNVTANGRVSWLGPGPFHGFPLLPTSEKQCQLGQLTVQGVNQMLHLGRTLKDNYASFWPKLSNLTQNEVNVYSTRYRRTFQSALAFLYGLLGTEVLNKISVTESQSMYFCFKDCGCQVTDKYSKYVKKDILYQLKSHPAISLLADNTARLIFSSNAETRRYGEDPHSVKDALLTYICHGSRLPPCDSPLKCIRRQNVVGIFTYTDWVSHQKWKNNNWKRLSLLRCYGMIRHIVQQMLMMFSVGGPYLVIYSGHDHTVEHLAAALGLQNDPSLLRYGARMVFEVYRKVSEPQEAKGMYFRLLTNGRDVTRQIDFCKNSIVVNKTVSLCNIESIIRFLHDDYFQMFNVTNFKDACYQQI